MSLDCLSAHVLSQALQVSNKLAAEHTEHTMCIDAMLNMYYSNVSDSTIASNQPCSVHTYKHKYTA